MKPVATSNVSPAQTRKLVAAIKTGTILCLRKAIARLKLTDPFEWDLAIDYIEEGRALARLAWDLELPDPAAKKG